MANWMVHVKDLVHLMENYLAPEKDLVNQMARCLVHEKDLALLKGPRTVMMMVLKMACETQKVWKMA